jgi:hypothetical protein
MPLHRFLRSMLSFYGLELHYLTPSGILHISAFVTLCEVYMGIEPHYNLRNYFFLTWLLQGSSVEAAVLGGVDIYVRSGHRVNPYFHHPLSGSTDGWCMVLFEEQH